MTYNVTLTSDHKLAVQKGHGDTIAFDLKPLSLKAPSASYSIDAGAPPFRGRLLVQSITGDTNPKLSISHVHATLLIGT